jgi:transposase
MTIPGVGVTTAATLIAAIGDVHRFPSAKRLVGYLGVDPRVRQSGQNPAQMGRISKQGSSAARHVLVEAAWSAIKTPGPLRAFYQRVRARRGAQIAIVATARKLVCLTWQLLSTEQDYAFKRQTIIDRKLRALELLAGDPKRHGHQHPANTPTVKQRAVTERRLTEQSELAYQRLIKNWTSTRT